MKQQSNSQLWVIIPGYNEEKHIANVVKGVQKYATHIVVVDDGSRDSTSKKASTFKNTIVLRHATNLGKGAALKTGCDYAIQNGASHLIVMDADGQHDPDEIPKFIQEIEKYDILFGARTFNKKMPGILKFGNKVINRTIEILFGMKLSDTQSGYRAFTRKAYAQIRWKSADYAMESEMIARAGKHKLKYREIGIRTIYNDRYKGTTVFDGVKIVLSMFLFKFTLDN